MIGGGLARKPRQRYVVWLVMMAALAAAPGRADIHTLEEGSDLIGETEYVIARHEDTLLDIARTLDLGYNEIKAANPGVDSWLPGEGTRIVLPKGRILPDGERKGLVLNLAEMRLYFYEKTDAGALRVYTHPVGIGRMDWRTPQGRTQVINKVIDPSWRPPASIKAEHAAQGDPLPDVVPAGPDNPLGRYALRLGIPGYLIHGTNKAYGAGMQVSHGCIRMNPEDIERLFPLVSKGTPVSIVNQPLKVGWREGVLYIEVHPPLEGENLQYDVALDTAVELIRKKTGDRQVSVDGAELRAAIAERRGIPVAISKPSS